MAGSNSKAPDLINTWPCFFKWPVICEERMGINSPVLFIVSLIINLSALIGSAEEVRCPPYFCNEKVGNLGFPFKNQTHPPECGVFTVDCSEPSRPKIQLEDNGYWHEFESISQSNTISINDKELQEQLDSCNDEVLYHLSLPNFYPASNVSTPSLIVLKCENNPLPNGTLDFDFGCSNAYHTYYFSSYHRSQIFSFPAWCSIMQLPVRNQLPYSFSGVTVNFSLQVQISPECIQCYNTYGSCQKYHGGEFLCFKEKRAEQELRLELVQVGAVAGFVTLVVIVGLLLRRDLSFDRSIFFWKKQDEAVKAFLRNYGQLQVRKYSYSDVTKMTNSFKTKLGQGGYGSVYKGKLPDGNLVAVKVLNKLKGNGEEFMNEVSTISKTSHVNVVSLLGFCSNGSERALIYEFMPNGSLEKFIFDANTSQKNNHLGWEALDRISLGIARGLEYLHRGCNTRILHFDIKPHNILLDANFSPKISDFGLAKICDRAESVVSMLGARGTAGYIAPEVFCRNFGGVSHKSDVYSFGMMLSEMVGGRRNINVEADNTSEIYFPHWIYKRLELDELGIQSVTNAEDKVRARKMIIVSLWCIQTNPSNRPGMKEVIEMLEGSVESLQIPPKPYLSSPLKSPIVAYSSTTLVSI